MRSEDYGRGYPKRSAGFSTGGASSEDAFEHMCEASDSQKGEAVNTIVCSLGNGDQLILSAYYIDGYQGRPAAVQDATEHFYIAAKKRGIL